MTLIDSPHHYKHVNRELLRYENIAQNILFSMMRIIYEIQKATAMSVARGKFKIIHYG